MKKISNVFRKIASSIIDSLNSLLDIATLRIEVKELKEKLKDKEKLEREYIDKISLLKSDNRIYKIQNTKLINKNLKLTEDIKVLKKKVQDYSNYSFNKEVK